MTDVAGGIDAIVGPYVGRTGGLISALRAVQDALGHLPPETDAVAADAFNLSRAEVKGVISFYADFHREPRGRTVLRLCAAEACQAAGGRALRAAVEQTLGLECGRTDTARGLTIEPVYCLGLCSVAPSAMVNDRLVARADVRAIETEIEKARIENAPGER